MPACVHTSARHKLGLVCFPLLLFCGEAKEQWLNQRYSKRGKGWEICKSRMDQCALKGYDVSLRHAYTTSAYLQASERVAKCQRQLCWKRYMRARAGAAEVLKYWGGTLILLTS